MLVFSRVVEWFSFWFVVKLPYLLSSCAMLIKISAGLVELGQKYREKTKFRILLHATVGSFQAIETFGSEFHVFVIISCGSNSNEYLVMQHAGGGIV